MTAALVARRRARVRVRGHERAARRVQRRRHARRDARGAPAARARARRGLQPARPAARRRRGRARDRRHRHDRLLGGGRGHRRRPARAPSRGTSLTWRWGLPSSSGHALVGGLVGAALVAGGAGAVHWGGLDGIHPVGVLGACIALAVSPPLGALAAFALVRGVRRGARRASRRWHELAQAAQWATSATLAFSHGANDAQKSAGVIAALLLADGRIDALSAPAVGDARLRRRADARHRGGRLEHRAHRGPAHLPPAPGRRALQPGRVGRGDPRRVAARRADVDDAGRRVVGRRRRRRPAALAPRALGGRAPDEPRVGA